MKRKVRKMVEISIFRARNTTGLAINDKRVTNTNPYGLIQTIQKFQVDEKEIINAIENVQPVKHGRWKQIGEQSAKCTACGGVLKSNGIDKTGKALIFNAVYHYCPYCGARMDGDAEGRCKK